ncbi:putative oxalate decarboxylase [Rhizoctonia solani AG-1 IA]|uniref:Putative oxalate decarboxylase n=1 Tax=Thanatephorus cucumeris (strain AG1-IA) TaxID=983506 RepID=L8WK29_THACA|nr:putative oxalate decarboxylase [Rhizoctonia solani AG-1 IA]
MPRAMQKMNRMQCSPPAWFYTFADFVLGLAQRSFYCLIRLALAHVTLPVIHLSMRIYLALALVLSTSVLGAPAPAVESNTSSTRLPSAPAHPSPTTDPSYPSPTVPYASNELNESFLSKFRDEVPEPIRGSKGANILGPQNVEIDRQNPDLLAPPTTDSGSVSNVKWPFSLSHNRVQDGGWARQQNVHSMPIATTMAGVNMRLKAGGIRELHWHITAEVCRPCCRQRWWMILIFSIKWAYVLAGSCRIVVVNAEGQNYIADVYPGDLWYFPPGIPHVLQGLNDTADGCEFLLVFDDGEFSEDSTFSVTDWMAHVPKEVLSKNFQVNASAFDHIPDRQLWMLPSAVPTGSAEEQGVKSPQGVSTLPYTFAASKANSIKVNSTHDADENRDLIDSIRFRVELSKLSTRVRSKSARLLQWRSGIQPSPNGLISSRITVFAAQSNARTFNYQAGDIGYVPPSFGHYVENIGNTTLKFLEIFNSDKYEDISLNQWLALTPPEMVKAHLQLSDDTINKLQKVKPIVVGPGLS